MMKTLNYTDEIEWEELQSLAKYKNMNLKIEGTFYFPVLFSIWDIEYKTFFRKDRKNTSITGVDLVKGASGLADYFPNYKTKEADEKHIISPLFPPEVKFSENREFIRRYYIHYRRIWSVPKIELRNEEVIHMPYTILSDVDKTSKQIKYYLLEHSSKKIDKLSNYKHIEESCLKLLKGGGNE